MPVDFNVAEVMNLADAAAIIASAPSAGVKIISLKIKTMRKKTMTTFVDLLMENGELVRIECPSKHEDRLHENIEHAMKRRDWWSPSQFEGCSAQYLGLCIDRVNMGKVIGRL